jgi:hypothetical protein
VPPGGASRGGIDLCPALADELMTAPSSFPHVILPESTSCHTFAAAAVPGAPLLPEAIGEVSGDFLGNGPVASSLITPYIMPAASSSFTPALWPAAASSTTSVLVMGSTFCQSFAAAVVPGAPLQPEAHGEVSDAFQGSAPAASTPISSYLLPAASSFITSDLSPAAASSTSSVLWPELASCQTFAAAAVLGAPPLPEAPGEVFSPVHPAPPPPPPPG